jgi:hypothetical protein
VESTFDIGPSVAAAAAAAFRGEYFNADDDAAASYDGWWYDARDVAVDDGDVGAKA